MFENLIRQTLVTPNFCCLQYTRKHLIKESFVLSYIEHVQNFCGYNSFMNKKLEQQVS